MNELPIAPIVLGHNAFFGVDHLSSARGMERAAYFADPDRVLAMIRTSVDLGATGLMLSTHQRAGPIADLIRAESDLKRSLTLYPLLPYAQKYVTRANEVGLVNMVLDTLSGTSWAGRVHLLWQGARAGVTKDVLAALGALIQLELKPFRNLRVGAVFLHDILTDLAVALDLHEIIAFYEEELPRRHQTRAAYATKNLPRLLQRFEEWGRPPPLVMTHFNKAGYHMNPSREVCEVAARSHPVEIMAMGTLASGYLDPDEAYAYLGGIAGIRSVVVGASSRSHAQETFAAITRHCSLDQ